MKKVKVLNQASFVYLFFTVVILIFAAAVTVPEEARALVFKLCIVFSVLSSIVLFILEGFYYPRIVNKKYLGVFKKISSAENEKIINRMNFVSNLLDHLLLILFFNVLLATTASKWSWLWLLTSFAWLYIAPYSFKMVRNNLRKLKDREAQRTSAQYLFELGINRQGVENCLWSTSNQEKRVVRRRWNLVAPFFPFMIAVYWLLISILTGPDADNGKTIVVKVLILVTTMIVVVLGGYVWYSSMNKRLEEIREIKKSFLNILNVVGE